MRTRSVTYAVAAGGLLALLVSTTMLARQLILLGAARLSPGEALFELATGAAAIWFWLGLIGAGVWGGAWLIATRAGRPDERLAPQPGRIAALYAGQMAALAALILQAILLIAGLLAQVKPAGWVAHAAGLAAGGVIALTFWGFLRWMASRAPRSDQESVVGAGWRRVYYYGGAAVTLALFLGGLMELLRIIVGIVSGVNTTSAVLADNRTRFAQAAAYALVGAPAWWALWWAQQTRAVAAGERHSRARRFYLYGVILVAAIGFFFGLGMSVFGVIAGRDRTLVATWGPIALIALVCLVGHLLTLREDERLADETVTQSSGLWSSPQAQSSGLRYERTAGGVAHAAGRISAAAAEPRHFQRESLPAVPIRPPIRPVVVVVDGQDGALGAQLMAGLAAALPHVVLWPLGLNAAAQVAMLNALGGAAPAVPADAAARATAIIGPSDMLIPGGLAGEVTTELAQSIADSPARKLLLPPRSPALRWVAAPAWPEPRWVENAVIEATNLLGEGR